MYWEINYNEDAFNPNLGFKVPGQITTYVHRNSNLSIDDSPEQSLAQEPDEDERLREQIDREDIKEVFLEESEDEKKRKNKKKTVLTGP